MLVPVAVLMFVLQLAFVRSGDAIALFITTDGLQTGGKACLRLVGVALPLVLMLAVTKLNDLANACVEVLRIPYKYAFTFMTALRFVPVFTQEMNAIMEAQTARGVQFDTRNPFKKMSLMLPVCIPLLVTSVGKTDATALAAESARLLPAHACKLLQALPAARHRHRRARPVRRAHRMRRSAVNLAARPCARRGAASFAVRPRALQRCELCGQTLRASRRCELCGQAASPASGDHAEIFGDSALR